MTREELIARGKAIMTEFLANPYGPLTLPSFVAEIEAPMAEIFESLEDGKKDFGDQWTQFNVYRTELRMWFGAQAFEPAFSELPEDIILAWGRRRVAHLRHLLEHRHQIIEPNVTACVIDPIYQCLYVQGLEIGMTRIEYREAVVKVTEHLLNRAKRDLEDERQSP